jgi:hypothetical protein
MLFRESHPMEAVNGCMEIFRKGTVRPSKEIKELGSQDNVNR